MKKLGIIVFIVALAIGVFFSSFFSFGRITSQVFHFNFSGVKGSGVAASETRNESGFKSVDVGGVFQVEITAQKDYSVEVSADDNLLQYIKTEVDGDTLRISSEKRINSQTPIIVRISAPNIEHVDASGASKVTVSGLKNSKFGLDTSGASKVDLSGETANLTIDVSGASKIDAENLIAARANVGASGASKVTLNATEDLIANASGASKISYGGNPKHVDPKSSGASSISPR
ncbi:MAG TPA: head GIN domain-containing protein [Pyrinomonadaceae bacterium]|jgi:hypothetical protein|nr:head GIN domain-containing protein [Pyrinomonadaceae bacterium]